MSHAKLVEWTRKQIEACQEVHQWLLEDLTIQQRFHGAYHTNPYAAALHGMLHGLDEMIKELKARIS